MISDLKHKANNAIGIFLVAAVLGFKVFVYDRVAPNPATPYILALLLSIAAASLFFHFRLRMKADAQRSDEGPDAR